MPLSVSASAGEFRPVAGAGVVSAYTKIDVRRDCRHRPGVEAEDYGDWRCRGYAGVPMWVGADDQRSYVSFGPKASEELAAEQTFAPFNSFYKGAVEWRLEKPEGRPFATIVRWGVKTTADLDKTSARGRVLVVTRLPPGAVCHVGYVDALANADANGLAREIADKYARGFDCGKDKPTFLGKVTPGEEFVSPAGQ
ncbi:MAG: hypothetical protein C3F11_05750 [Methylocystaceae bacterium]|nr:MAG: hypothetical protein C3F11_05750 [Methylocystaceae bacterium]